MKKPPTIENKAASPGDPIRELTPKADPASVRRVQKLVLHIGGKRYEFSHRMEVREIVKGPATVIEMPPPAV